MNTHPNGEVALESVPLAQSPFLPGTNIQFAWDSTSLGLLKTCPRLYQYTMVEGWGSTGESVHLRFGSEYHAALQEYDLCRADGADHNTALYLTIAALMERTCDFAPDPDSKAGRYKSRDQLISLVIDYLDFYERDPAETYIRTDGKPAVELSFRFELDFGPATQIAGIEKGQELLSITGEVLGAWQPYLLCGHLDRVVRFNSQLLVMDHKTTTTTLNERFFEQWEPSNQMTLYTLAGKVILNAPIRGVCISGAQIRLEEPNLFVRGFTYRTQDQLDEWLGDLGILLRTNETYAEANYWPQNDTACDKFGGCRFRGVCSKSPHVRQAYLKADFTKLSEGDRWNPLKAR